MLLLAIWLIAWGLAAFIPALSGLGQVLAIPRHRRRNLHLAEPLGQLPLGQPVRWLPKIDQSKGEISCCGRLS